MPWIALDCAIGEHPKMAVLRNDSARYGWILVLLAAKRQTRQGRFASVRHFQAVLHGYAKFLPDYETAGLLERDQDDALLVHDWERYQWKAAKERQREDNGGTTTGQTQDKNETYIDRDIDKDKDRERDRATKAVAVVKPRASGPRDEPRLTEAQLRSWSGFGREWSDFKEAWMARGLYFAPFGSPDDDDTSQRGILFQVLDARPTDIVRWVREAPKPTAREVITYILEQWHDIRANAGVDDGEWEETKREERRVASGGVLRIGSLLEAKP